MSNQEAPFSGNFKIAGFQQTVRGNTFQEYIVNLLNFEGHPDVDQALAVANGKQHEQTVAVVQTVFPNSTVIEQTPAAPAQPFAPVAPPVTATTPATPTGPVCKHGAMTYRTGTNKNNGAPWAGYFCPSPKGTPDQCPPQFGK